MPRRPQDSVPTCPLRLWSDGIHTRMSFISFSGALRTICCKLRLDQTPRLKDVVGGSTYTFVVWEGHPMDEEAQRGLARYREFADDLRARIDAYNAEHGIPARHRKVVAYSGQCLVEEEPET